MHNLAGKGDKPPNYYKMCKIQIISPGIIADKTCPPPAKRKSKKVKK